ncbi:MAG: 2Fe-2S iron-sulfur cluster binding domain-containing protein [Alphaproteobacteria bacterium]|nr:2Fe-2S iron-sulfur cluster binding domain-containing protein [Alphaproteobacteria bacterium]
MRMELSHRDGAIEFDCAAGEKILLAGLGAGHVLPYECGTGSCGTCKATLSEGSVAPGWLGAPGRKHIKADAGEILMCQAEPATDCRLAVRARVTPAPDRVLVPAHRESVVREVVQLNRDVFRLVIEPAAPVSFDAGQFMLVQVPGVAGYRGWSMAQFRRPAGLLIFTVKLMPNGQASAWLAGGSAKGTRVALFGPLGRAVFRPAEVAHLLCIAGGSGLAPMLAVLDHAASCGHLRRHRAEVFFGVRGMADLYGMDELLTVRDAFPDTTSLTVALSHESPTAAATAAHPNVTFATGFVHAVAGHAMVGRYADVTAYLAGPPPMVEAAMRMLVTEAKLPVSRIRFDKFS